MRPHALSNQCTGLENDCILQRIAIADYCATEGSTGVRLLLWVCPGVASGVMRLDAYALAGIMQCIITQWNDPYLVSLNSNTMYVSTCIHWCDDHLSVSCWIVNLENCTWSYVLSAVKPSE